MELSHIQLSSLELFANDDELMGVVKQIMLQRVKKERDTVIRNLMKSNMSNEEIGATLRASAEGVRLVEAAFQDLAQYKTKSLPIIKPHPTR